MAGIMIVEDEQIVALDIKQSLIALGYTVSAMVMDGETAIRKSAEIRPDLVLMDITLKGKTGGVEAAEHIRKDFNIPIIFLTAHNDENTLQRAKETGPYAFLLKPFEERELYNAIEIALYKHRFDLKFRRMEEKFRTIILKNADGILVLDREGAILYLNPAAESLLGRKEESLIGSCLGVPVIRGEKSELDIFNPQKGQLTVEMRVAETDWEGQPAFIASLRDVTERKQFAEKLQEGNEKLWKSLRGTVAAIASTVEIRDPYTAGHQKRVSALARTLAQEMSLSEERIEGVHMAGIVHDLGKMGIPAEILSKPTKLTDIEFGLIKCHPDTSYQILKGIEFPWPVAQIVHQHHERIDGSGYPLGLKDGEILQEAKILAVADVVEAISSHRPYRPALGLETALGEITKNRGKIYDPEVVDCCLRLFREKGYAF